MDDAHIEELMWFEIDGTISSADREALNTRLRAHPEARDQLAALQRMALLFGQIGEIDPPAELRERILHALETARPPRSHRMGLFARLGAGRTHGQTEGQTPGGFLDRLASLFAPRPAWALVAAVAAGAVIGIFGYHLIRSGVGNTGSTKGGSSDNARFYGAMNKDSFGRDGAVLHIGIEGVSGELRVRRDASHVFSELDIRSEREVEIVLDYDGTPIDIATDEPSRRPSNEIAVRGSGVRVTQQGSGSYRFSFTLAKDCASPMKVSVLSDKGAVLYRASIVPPSGPAER
jgi:hypothetical protein